MKYIVPLFFYLLLLVISIFLPASDGYNTIGWKLLLAQIYAIPLFFFVYFLFFILSNTKQKN